MTTAHEYVIETRALSKRYGRKLALDHLDSAIPRGHIHAIVISAGISTPNANAVSRETTFFAMKALLHAHLGEGRTCGWRHACLSAPAYLPRNLRSAGDDLRLYTIPQGR